MHTAKGLEPIGRGELRLFLDRVVREERCVLSVIYPVKEEM